jgi:putative YhbY family RNA-binding protein
MKTTTLPASARQALKGRAHALDPVVMIGDAGLTDGVLREIERSLKAHELIKVRVAGDDREARAALFERIAELTHAHPIQHIGKLLVFYRPLAEDDDAPAAPVARKGGTLAKTARVRAPTPAKSTRTTTTRGSAPSGARLAAKPARAAPASGARTLRTSAARAGAGAGPAKPAKAERKPPSRPSRAAAGKTAARPPRTTRVRKSGQRSSKKAFQDQ